MREVLQCCMVGVSWSILDGACWSDSPDQLPRSPLQKTQFSDQLTPVGTKLHLNKDLSVKNADARSFKIVLCHLLFYLLSYNLFKN